MNAPEKLKDARDYLKRISEWFFWHDINHTDDIDNLDDSQVIRCFKQALEKEKEN